MFTCKKNAIQTYLEKNIEASIAQYEKFGDKYRQKIAELIECVEGNLKACDFRFTLFIAAANSYRWQSYLKKFPETFVDQSNNNFKDINLLLTTTIDVPPLDSISKLYFFLNAWNPLMVELLHWVLLKESKPHMSTVNRQEYAHFLRKWVEDIVPVPLRAFAIGFHTETFRRTKLAFFITKLDRIYGFLHYGLEGNHKAGKELILLEKLSDAIKHAPKSTGWGGSQLGRIISCVIGLEFEDDPLYVEKYVQNDYKINCLKIKDIKLVKMRYIFVYGSGLERVEKSAEDKMLEHVITTISKDYLYELK